MKFGRTYSMTVQVDDIDTPSNVVVVNYPLTVEFEVIRNVQASANTGRFVVYNLKEGTRKRIFHDRFDTTTIRRVSFRAGYVNLLGAEGPIQALPTIFQGNIISAYSYRKGQDWVTEIEAFDGGGAILNGQVSVTLPADIDLKASMKKVMESLFQWNVTQGVIGDFGVNKTRGASFAGNSWDVLQRLTGNGNLFIDNEQVNVLQNNEYIDRAPGIELINSQTGLLNTPRRRGALIDMDMLFEPRLTVGQILQVESLETINNGVYKVMGIAHRGIISGAVGGNAVTTASVFTGTARLKGVAQ